MANQRSKEECQLDVNAYIESGGNVSETARLRGVKRQTMQNRLAAAEVTLGIKLGKIVDGRVEQVKAAKRPVPKSGAVFRYLLTAAQNNTHAHSAGLKNLESYCAWLNKLKGRPNDKCELIVGSFTYAIDAYGAKAVKRGTYQGAMGKLWYSPELVKYLKDESIQLAPGLIWCGELNILPTATNPLTRMDDYNGRASNIVPHVRHAMESVASLADEATKFNYSTGTITLRNYIQKRAGQLADRSHHYGALIVEVDSDSNWYVRQISIGEHGEIYDIGPSGYRGVKIEEGKVQAIIATAPPAKTFLEAISWGDIHAAEMDLAVRVLGWEDGGMLDQLAPRNQFWHDVFSMRARGHHELKNFHRTYSKFVTGEGNVEDEMNITADFMKEGARDWCGTFVVRSNHDRHLDRWLNEAKPERDPMNAKYFNELQYQVLNAMDNGDRDFNVLEWALRKCGIPKNIRFLGEDESFVICKKTPGGGVECGLHGDLGPNGSRGSTQSLMRLGRAANKAHDHTATIRGPVYSAGACSLSFPYMKGPNSHSVSHVNTFVNGSRQIVTFWQGKFRA